MCLSQIECQPEGDLLPENTTSTLSREALGQCNLPEFVDWCWRLGLGAPQLWSEVRHLWI